MAVPTVGANLVSGGSSAAGTTLVLTLTATIPVGDVLVIALSITVNQTITVIDSKGNTYVNTGGNSTLGTGVYTILITQVTKALAISDTITITLGVSDQGMAAAMIQLTGIPQNQTALNGYAGVGTTNTGTSTSAASNALVTTKPDDCIFLFIVGTINAGALLATDFTSGSVDQSYTIADSAVSTGGTSNVGAAICYKTVVATPASQSPTFTLNASRQWATKLFMYSGINARGAIGTWLRTGDGASGIANYVPHANDTLGKVPYGQIAQSPFDGSPQSVITPSKPKNTQPTSDGLLNSE